jgi:hypothetical protein
VEDLDWSAALQATSSVRNAAAIVYNFAFHNSPEVDLQSPEALRLIEAWAGLHNSHNDLRCDIRKRRWSSAKASVHRALAHAEVISEFGSKMLVSPQHLDLLRRAEAYAKSLLGERSSD